MPSSVFGALEAATLVEVAVIRDEYVPHQVRMVEQVQRLRRLTGRARCRRTHRERGEKGERVASHAQRIQCRDATARARADARVALGAESRAVSSSPWLFGRIPRVAGVPSRAGSQFARRGQLPSRSVTLVPGVRSGRVLDERIGV